MPQNRNSTPPPTMTWGTAMPVIVVAGVFDLLRMFFEMFWFFGPALAALYCTAKVSSVVGTTLAGFACTASAGVAGFFGAGPIAALGVVMAIAVGLLGFLTLGLWILMTNARIFKANATGALWFIGSLAISEMPLIGTIPAFSITLWKLYKTQIRVEGETLQKWEKEHAQEAAAQIQQRQQQAAQFMQVQNAQMEQQEAANDEEYDNEEIPDEVREAA